MENKIISFESRFGKPEKFNSQFHMVKIYIAYAGKNRNMSIISKETFEKMIPSLYGIPVVGEWKEKNEDFGSHGGKIEITDEGIDFIDTTKPYGFVDSSATVQWENVTEKDGTVREYLTTTAFLWTERYPEALKVLENKSNQSMEINVFDGDMSEDYPDYYEILDGEFSALCILGEDVEPCFESAKVSQFNLDKDEFKAEFTQMVNELRKSLHFTKQDNTDGIEGGEDMKDKGRKFDDEEVEETETVEETNDIETSENTEEDYEDTKVDKEEKEEDDKEEVDKDEEDYELKYNNLLQDYQKIEEKYNNNVKELEELKEFKAQKDKEEFEAEQERIREEKIEHINTEYANISDDIKELFISKVDEYESTEDIDADICVYIVKNKVTFSKVKNNKDKSVVKVKVDEEKSNKGISPYGNLF